MADYPTTTGLPVITLLTREALQVVDVRPRPHHHLECRDGFVTGRAVTRVPEQSAQIWKQRRVR